MGINLGSVCNILPITPSQYAFSNSGKKAVFLLNLIINIAMMKITLNNRPEEIEGGPMSINELIKYKNFSFKLLVTKINGNLVRTNERDEAKVKDGDNVQILHLISGG